jgi:hypothetical protein
VVPAGFARWGLIMVAIALILALVVTATVVMAGAILQPQVLPVIKVEPAVVAPGDVVVVTGRGWPTLNNLVLVVALSPTRELVSEGLLPVSAANVALDGTLVATFVFPAELPWAEMREAWVVVRPGTGNLQAAARLVVRRPRPTPTPTMATAATPMPGRHQLQGTIVELAPERGVLILQPFEGGANRGVTIGAARVQSVGGHTGSLADLKVGLSVVALGWFDSAGTLIAEQITILEVTGPPVSGVLQAPPAEVAVRVPASVPINVPVAAPTSAPAPVPVVAPTCLLTPPPVRPAPPPVEGQLDSWMGAYYANPSLAGVPAAVRECEVIDFDWRWGAPVKCVPELGYSVRWVGLWTFPHTSSYRFRLLLKGAGRLSVDGRLILDQWGYPPPAEYQADIDLAAGVHTVTLEFRNTDPKGRVQLRWEYGDMAP